MNKNDDEEVELDPTPWVSRDTMVRFPGRGDSYPVPRDFAPRYKYSQDWKDYPRDYR